MKRVNGKKVIKVESVKVLRVWKYALGSFHDDKTQKYDNWVCFIRTVIMLQLVVTNSFIVAGNIRHWDDHHTPPHYEQTKS